MPILGPARAMTGFVKIYGSILQSSVWLEDAETRVLWITLLAMADRRGMVAASVGGLAHAANITRAKCEAALVVLTSPDLDSKSKQFEGRRIRSVRGGWLILNYLRYRELRTEDQIAEADRKREWRKSKRNNGHSAGHVPNVPGNAGPSGTDVEAEAEAEREKRQPPVSAARNRTNGVRIDVLATGELVNTIKRLAVTPPQGDRYIPRAKVEELGPDVLRAYEAVGGAARFLIAKASEFPFLVRAFAEALQSARAHATVVARSGAGGH